PAALRTVRAPPYQLRHIDELAKAAPPRTRFNPEVYERAGRPGILDVHRQPGAHRQAAADMHVAPAELGGVEHATAPVHHPGDYHPDPLAVPSRRGGSVQAANA